MSRPVLLSESGIVSRTKPAIYIRGGHNPMLASLSDDKGVPNDYSQDISAKLVLMNGPNGSGKTTLLRMIALNIILA